MKKQNTPELRFKGFEDEWEEKKLGEISEKITEKNTNFKYNSIFTNSAEFGVIDQSDFFDNQIANKNNIDGYYVIKQNEFVYNPRISVTAPVGPINRNKLNRIGVMSPLYYVFNVFKIDLTFLEYFFKTSKWYNFMFLNGNSGARSDRFSISDNVFTQLPIKNPTSPDEQEQIGAFFKNLDAQLFLAEEKLEKTKTLKKTMLQKMFPQNNSKVPQIRLQGFSGDWEEKRFGDLATEYQSKTVIENEGILLSCAIEGIFLNSELFNHFRGSSTIGYLKIKKGDMILSAQNLHLGNANINLRFDSGIISPAYKVYELKNVDKLFFSFWLKREETKDFFLSATTEGASLCRKNIDWNLLLSKKLLLPKSENEQKAIASFFDSLSSLISSQTEKLNLLKTLKKSFLEKMFV